MDAEDEQTYLQKNSINYLLLCQDFTTIEKGK